MLTTNEIKQQVGKAAVELIKEGMTVGLGSGSTVFYLIEELGKKTGNGFKCIAIPTSEMTRTLAGERGIPIAELNDVPSIDITIDGADEIDNQLQLIKGGGGALLQEKMVAAASNQLIIIADYTKWKNVLGDFPLPIEVVPYGWKLVRQKIHDLYLIKSKLRMQADKPFITDHGHYILDCPFIQINDPAGLNSSLHLIPGVVETGLFIDMCNMTIIGYPDGSVKQLHKSGKKSNY